MRTVLVALFLMISSAVGATTPMTPASQAEVLENTARLLETRYVEASQGRQLAAQLRRERSRWADITDPEQFATKVTEWLRQQGRDGHLGLTYSREVLSDEVGDAQIDAAEDERWYGKQINHGVERIERLEGNIMLLDLRVFPPPHMGADVIAAAMNVVAQGDALIIDLRRNGGGGETINLVTGYLLDKPEQPLSGTFDRPSNTLRPSRSPAWVPGPKFGGKKPLFILTSNRTFSAAEAFSYDLQALGRATIVGERTGGGANPFEYRRVGAHFALN